MIGYGISWFKLDVSGRVMMIKNLIKNYVLTEDEKHMVDALNSSEVTSRRVVGRGTLTMDPAEVRGTRKFNEQSEQAAELFHSLRR